MCPDALTACANMDTIWTLSKCVHIKGTTMGTDQFEDWKTQAEAAEILQVSPRTIARLAAQQKLQRGLRRVPGRKPLPVFHPGDIEAIRAETVQVKPFPVSERPEGTALARRPNPAAVDLIAQLFADQTALPRAVPVEQKIFLTLKEAADYSGLPKAWLLRDIKSGKLQAIKAGGWRIRRSALDHL